MFAPLLGRRWVKVTDRRTRHDWAHLIRELVDDILPGKKIVLMMDDLKIHSLASLYEAFEPAEARRVAVCLEIHFTPKHGSWLNLAEIEIGVLARQCLARRIPDRERLCRETGAWQAKRNRESASVDWRFKTEDARIKLKLLYPSIQLRRNTSASLLIWGNCSPGGSSGYSVSWLRQWTAFPCRAMLMATRGLYPSAAMVWR